MEAPALPGLGSDRDPPSSGAPEKAFRDHAGVREISARYEAFYREANHGASPTPGAKQNSQIAGLIRKHGAAEVERRMSIMFTSPPPWMAPPFDLGTLVLLFDKFATASSSARNGRVGRPDISLEDHENDPGLGVA